MRAGLLSGPKQVVMHHKFAFFFSLCISCGGRQYTSHETHFVWPSPIIFLLICHQVSAAPVSSEQSASLLDNTTRPRSEHAAAPSDAGPMGAVSTPATGQSGGGPDNKNRIYAKAEAYYNKSSKSKLCKIVDITFIKHETK